MDLQQQVAILSEVVQEIRRACDRAADMLFLVNQGTSRPELDQHALRQVGGAAAELSKALEGARKRLGSLEPQ